jgi:hypothetical protein
LVTYPFMPSHFSSSFILSSFILTATSFSI